MNKENNESINTMKIANELTNLKSFENEKTSNVIIFIDE